MPRDCLTPFPRNCLDEYTVEIQWGWTPRDMEHMAVWLYGCMAVWLYGCMAVWLYGLMA
jgi:hypothetical protein